MIGIGLKFNAFLRGIEGGQGLLFLFLFLLRATAVDGPPADPPRIRWSLVALTFHHSKPRGGEGGIKKEVVVR
jgi:hypothetical protein